ncbi:hypothetical protein COT97_04860 [Candidatus Falkowbacteria bacterium CG10_big_fil_rev_8_21_14_0_10_39_11]|uniref:ABC transporter substrate-binding protein n=1 Tax=Candidatus Falkowbacteria bacterium CG10_big_fil_rev_8_21_14_0_10_39_11 TaxID=1974565 RepID=A0A2H0V3X6_9BACT|nr:MAG: hypothetical protein COT97_04860 [Candidatus Falkowbacteria bacterium CG10_big_fil_rev_8_21_14_0_10_39_11]
MKKRLFSLITLFLIATFLITTGASCAKGGSLEAQRAMQPLTLKVWTVFDERDAYTDIINSYRQLHPNVTIEFRKLRFEEYEKELLEAFALDEGPDIFSVHNTWVSKYQNLLEPMPRSVTVPYKKTVGTVKKEEVIELVTQNLYTPSQIVKLFGDTVAMDAIKEYNAGSASDPKMVNGVYALPMSLDTLALYYNKDILNNAGIALPAVYWTDLQEQVEKIRRVDADNNILLAAIPMGTARNIERSFDILSLLMMQLKTEMVTDRDQVSFHLMPRSLQGNEGITQPPAYNALEFYTSFADPLLNSYTWNNEMENSLQAFIDGQTAYFAGYSYHRPIIDAQAPKLNYDIAPMLQVQGYDTVNFANYWMQGVAKKSEHKDFAWDFVKYMTAEPQVSSYLEKTQKPSALRTLYDSQLENEEVAVFTEQILTAQTWYRGKDSVAAEEIFFDMIESVNSFEATAKEAVNLAAQRMTQTYK